MKVGDLVYVAKACPFCGDNEEVGYVFRIERTGEWWPKCHTNPVRAAGCIDFGFPIECLRVIPPLNELEAEKAVETV